MKRAFWGLRSFRRQHFEMQRIIKAVAVAIPTIVIGNWLLYIEVSTIGLDPEWAWRTNWPIITFLCFILNRTFTWDDREKKNSLVKWVIISAAHSSVSQVLYPQLVESGLNYMLASVILLGLGPITYTLHSLITFRRKATEMV